MTDRSRYDRRGPDPRFPDLDQFADRALDEEARVNKHLAAVVEAEAMLGEQLPEGGRTHAS